MFIFLTLWFIFSGLFQKCNELLDMHRLWPDLLIEIKVKLNFLPSGDFCSLCFSYWCSYFASQERKGSPIVLIQFCNAPKKINSGIFYFIIFIIIYYIYIYYIMYIILYIYYIYIYIFYYYITFIYIIKKCILCIKCKNALNNHAFYHCF